MNHGNDPSYNLPPSIHPDRSPLLPQHLVALFVHPREFFGGQLALGKTPYMLLVAWCYGATYVLDRLDQNLLRAEMGVARTGWESFAPYVVESWIGFWVFLIVFGAISGMIVWWVGGWWFGLRLRWSGADDPDRHMARLVMAYSAFVHTGPTIVATLVATLAFNNYADAFASDEMYSLVLLIFPFWSIATSYTGVRTVFGVDRWRTKLWFLILPIAFYLLVIGVLAGLVIFLLGDMPPA